jgi:transposase-like protein
LLVPQKDAEAAIQLLDESTPEKFAVEGVGEYEQPHCPKCGSMDISLDGSNKPLTSGAMYIASVPIPVTTAGWKCHSCGHQWNEDQAGSAASSHGQQTN